MATPPQIAKCAIDHCRQSLPSNGGKPQAGREWTVYAAIVACRSRGVSANTGGSGDKNRSRSDDEARSDLWVVSCATGSKCTSVRAIASSFPSATSAHVKNKDGCGASTENANKNRRRGAKNKTMIDMDEDSICKCYNGMILKDSHAETLARRGLMACLWSEIETSLKQHYAGGIGDLENTSNKGCETQQLLQRLPPGPQQDGLIAFRLKQDVSLHMYISDSPCGDAAIYEIRRKIKQTDMRNMDGVRENDLNVQTELNFTGAKIILSGNRDECESGNGLISSTLTCPVGQPKAGSDAQQSTITLGREDIQKLGALRVKSSRSNIPPELRTTSMSCSDKLVRWGVIGMQGSLLSTYIPNPICLSSICVSKDPRSVDGGTYGGQFVALERALCRRITSALKSVPYARANVNQKPPNVAVVEQALDCSKSASENRCFEAQINERKRLIEQTSCPGISAEDLPRKVPRMHDSQNVSSCKGKLQIPENSAQSWPAAKKESACGMSINWHQTYCQSITNAASKSDARKATEVTVGATGLKRGKKAKSPLDVLCLSSRLCRFNFLLQCKRCESMTTRSIKREEKTEDAIYMTNFKSAGNESYRKYKRRSNRIREDWEVGLLQGWIRSGKDDGFIIPHQFSSC